MNTTANRWPTFIISIVLAFGAISWWSLDRAASGVSSVSDANYYSHGLKYNSTNLEIQTAQALGWTITPEVQGRRLTIQVSDAKENGISGCQGLIALSPETVEQKDLPPLALTDAGQGLYTAEIPPELPTTFTASLSLRKGQATVQRRLLINLTP